jgi:hypothetical protein
MLKYLHMKEAWLMDLADFIIEANKNTWAADAPEVSPQRPGYQELEYKSSNGLWLLRDSYTGYFRAPGMTTIYYKNAPSWAMAYGGHGMTEAHNEIVKPTFQFLKNALMKVTPKLPYRGPEEYIEDDWRYSFEYQGNLEDCLWTEKITKAEDLVFTQTGFAGIIIQRNEDRKPQYPWELQ